MKEFSNVVIFILNEGTIEAEGTHEELIKKEGTYKNFIMNREKAMNWKL
ncbi:hypothetical protein [Allofustis seminis]|nr:hypothetical protein [Allofustis seminis]